MEEKSLANRGWLLMAIVVVLWSANAIIGRAVHETIPPIGLGFWRWVVALPVFALLALPHIRRDWPIALAHWPIVTVLAVLSITVYNTFVYIGLNSTTAINLLLINSARPVIIVFLSYAIVRERITAGQAFGFGLAMCGTLVILSRGSVEVLAGARFIAGDLWVVAATVAWAFYTVLFPRRPPIHPTSLMLVTMVLGMAVLLPFYLWEALFVRAVPVSAQAFWVFAYLGLIAGGLGYLCYNRLVEVVGANRAGLTSYLVPVLGTILAVTLLGEEFRTFHAAGIALILVGVLLAVAARRTLKAK